MKAFKLFVVDVGLLSCMTGLSQRTLLDGNFAFVEFKGALTEQFVCQQLKTIENIDVYYYTNDRGSCEIDFIVDLYVIHARSSSNAVKRPDKIIIQDYREEFNSSVKILINIPIKM